MDFVTKFHNLEGLTIQEKKKNLHLLLRDKNLTSNTSLQNEFVKNLTPKTFLESIFRVDVLISFHKTKEIYEIFKEGNDVLVSKIIKQPWFIKETFTNVPIKTLVNEVIPTMSYALRMKVLKKITACIPEDKCNDLFDAVSERYGVFVAQNFLSSCSANKIKDVLVSNDILVHAGHLKKFFKKDQNLIIVYMEERKKHSGGNFSVKELFSHIAEKDIAFFLELQKKFPCNVLLGRRTTKKVIDFKKEDIITNPKEYTSILKRDVIPSKLKGDFRIFYKNLFPTSIDNAEGTYTCNKYLKYFPKKYQYTLYSETFTNVFNESLDHHLKWVCDEDILNLIPDPKEKEKFAAIKYKETDDVRYLKYYTAPSAIPIIKERINFTSDISQRADLLKLLVVVCYNNYDLKSLEEVIKYFCLRHRNEDRSGRAYFISNIVNKFKYEDFNENHWNGIVDIIKIQRMKEEYIGDNTALYKYMEFLHRNSKPLQEALDVFLKDVSTNGGCLPSEENYNPDVWRLMLEEFVKKYTSLLPDEEYSEIRLIGYLLSFNSKHPNKAIDILGNERFCKLLKSKIDNYMIYDHYANVYEFICKENRNKVEDEIMEKFWQYCEGNESRKIIKWFMKNEFQTFNKHIDKVIKVLFSTNERLWYWMKKYSHLDFDKKLTEYCKQAIAKKPKDYKPKHVEVLTIVMSPEDLLMTVEEYLPKSDKVDLEDEEAKEFYSLQCEFAKHLKNTVCISVVFPAILKFSVGDYLGSALPSLYSAFYRIPENKLDSALKHLSNKAVSVRKHALFLCCHLADEATVIELLKNSGSTEKNSSIKKHLFSVAMRYFCRSPSDETWALVETFMNFIEKSDTESLDLLINSKMPSKYKALQWKTSWTFFEKNKETFAKCEEKFASLLRKFDVELMQQLDINFILKIIRNNFLKNGKLMDYDCLNDVVIQVLIAEKRIDTFKFVFEIVSEYKKHNWDPKDNKSATAISDIYQAFLRKRDNYYFTNEIVVKFLDHWNKIFTPVETFKEFVALNVIKLYKEADSDLEPFIKKLTPFVENLYAHYSPLQEIINKIIVYILGVLIGHKEENKLTVCRYLLESKQRIEINMLVLKFLPSISKTADKNLQNLYNDILAQIGSVQVEAIQIYYNLNLQNQI